MNKAIRMAPGRLLILDAETLAVGTAANIETGSMRRESGPTRRIPRTLRDPVRGVVPHLRCPHS